MCTRDRPAGLNRTLASLAAEAGDPGAALIVLDNGDGSAAQACAPFGGAWGARLHCLRETRPGLAFARNAALRAALELGAQAVAFIDDDEFASPGWLGALESAMERLGADVVEGPVASVFEQEPAAWVRAGGFFQRKTQPTGTRLDQAHAGNVLVRRRVFEALGGFDPLFNESGGEDTEFFRRCARAGFKIVACAEAEVRETVPPSRTTLSWVVLRALRLGNTWALCEIRERGIRRLRYGAEGLARLALGLPLALIGLLAPAAGVAWLRRAARGAGYLMAVLGRPYRAYTR